MILGISAFGGFPLNDCQRCPNSEGLRKRWGCEAPASTPLDHVPCLKCSGRDKKCKRCKGLGAIPIYRCPTTFLPRKVREVSMYFGQWSNGTLPVAGGILDQSATFVDAMRVLEIAKSEMEERRSDEAKRQAKMSQSKPPLQKTRR